MKKVLYICNIKVKFSAEFLSLAKKKLTKQIKKKHENKSI